MNLTLMYITNDIRIAKIAQSSGVDRIWVDMEYIGKEERQYGMNTVKSHHTVEDVLRLRPVIDRSQLMVRVNPIHDATKDYCSTEEEVENVIEAGADVVMLPMFRTVSDVERFVSCVNRRATVQLLVETAEAAENIDEICKVSGVDEIHIGLNDLHLAYKRKFMFELLADGTVDRLCRRIKDNGIKFGFGGIARIGYGMLPAEYVIAEHYRLGSEAAILSRGFCDANRVSDPSLIADAFREGVKKIREREKEVSSFTAEQFEANRTTVIKIVNEIVSGNA